MKKTLRWLTVMLCVAAVTLGCVSCASKPSNAKLKEDIQFFLSLDGKLPFTYEFKEFTIEEQNLQSKYKTCDTTVTARVETYYGEELFSDMSYTLTLSYDRNSDGTWVLHYVTVQDSEIFQGFDADSVFLGNLWAYSEPDSLTLPGDLSAKGVPQSFSFSQSWKNGAALVTTTMTDDAAKTVGPNTYWGMGEYKDRFAAGVDWDFRLIYSLYSGGVLDLVHLKGQDLYSSSSWVLGYRATTNDTFNLAIYRLSQITIID